MVRGIERRSIFCDDLDREDWLARLDRILPESLACCFAWVLMSNHVHLVLQSGPVSISQIMARIGTGYALRFNVRHRRHGHLFQNRFKSRLVTSDGDLLNLIRYVHRNPIQAGIVPDVRSLETFPWSGHAALSGQAPARSFHHADAALSLFGEDLAKARLALHRFMTDPDPPDVTASTAKQAPEPASPPCARTLVPGRGNWAATEPDPTTVTPESRPRSWEQLLRAVTREFGLQPVELLGPSKQRRLLRARSTLCSLAVRELGLSGLEVATRLAISPAAVSRALYRIDSHPSSESR